MAFTPPSFSSVYGGADKFKQIKSGRDREFQAALGQATTSNSADFAQKIGAAAQAGTGQQAAGAQKELSAGDIQQAESSLSSQVEAQKLVQAKQAQADAGDINNAANLAKTTLQREGNAADQDLTDQEIASKERLQKMGIETDNTLGFLDRSQREALASLGSDVKEKIYDSRLQFDRDEVGRKFTNERQLADYAIASSKSEEQLMRRLTAIKNAARTESLILDQAEKTLMRGIGRAAETRQGVLDRASRERLVQMKIAAEKAAAKKKAKRNATSSIIVGAATIAGAVIGAAYTGGAGTAAGATAGAAIGGAAGNIIDSQSK